MLRFLCIMINIFFAFVKADRTLDSRSYIIWMFDFWRRNTVMTKLCDVLVPHSTIFLPAPHTHIWHNKLNIHGWRVFSDNKSCRHFSHHIVPRALLCESCSWVIGSIVHKFITTNDHHMSVALRCVALPLRSRSLYRSRSRSRSCSQLQHYQAGLVTWSDRHGHRLIDIDYCSRRVLNPNKQTTKTVTATSQRMYEYIPAPLLVWRLNLFSAFFTVMPLIKFCTLFFTTRLSFHSTDNILFGPKTTDQVSSPHIYICMYL